MRILREPLLHFLALGTLVYSACVYFSDDTARYRIEAGPQRQARIRSAYEQQYGVAPTAAQLQELLDHYVRDEILYREGLSLGLEQDDEIVRRRVVQKLEFVNEDLQPQGSLDEGTLQRYFETHRDRYNTTPTVTFRHIFVSADAGGGAVALARTQEILQSLRKSDRNGSDPRYATLGDPFAEGQEFTALSRAAANSLFGDTQLSEVLFTKAGGGWGGPYRSAYGWHLIHVVEQHEAQPASLNEVKARVTADCMADLRAQRNQLAFRRIAGKYRVITGGPRT
jgi:peptidyl-prolyl cis-trans isomerase C